MSLFGGRQGHCRTTIRSALTVVWDAHGVPHHVRHVVSPQRLLHPWYSSSAAWRPRRPLLIPRGSRQVAARPPIMERMQKNSAAKRNGPASRFGSWWWFTAGVLASPGSALVVLRLLPWDIGTPWIQLLSFFPASLVLTMAAFAAALAAVCFRPIGNKALLAALVGVVLLVQLGMVADRVLPSSAATANALGEPAPAAGLDGLALTVMAVNVGSTGIDVQALVAEVRSRKVDVLALPELRQADLEKLDSAGLAALLPGRALDVDGAGIGNALFARFPLEQEHRVPDSMFDQSKAKAKIQGAARPVRFTAVHVVSPRLGYTPLWRAELRQLGELSRDAREDGHVILLGDFNASADHREFRDLLSTGLTDAAQTAGKGLNPTWPTNSPAPAFVALDHVLVTPGIEVADFQTITIPGTDHAAVVARLVLP